MTWLFSSREFYGEASLGVGKTACICWLSRGGVLLEWRDEEIGQVYAKKKYFFWLSAWQIIGERRESNQISSLHMLGLEVVYATSLLSVMENRWFFYFQHKRKWSDFPRNLYLAEVVFEWKSDKVYIFRINSVDPK